MPTHTVIMADAHLDGHNRELAHFLKFLTSLRNKDIKACYILGDLFSIWLGVSRLQLSHQKPVIEALQTVREAGVQVIYVEGNRDYFLAPRFLNAPFQTIATEAAQASIGGKRFYFSHGDLLNVHDRQYRLWRKFSKNRLVFSVFQALPRKLAFPLVDFLERTFRETNQKHKSYFPESICRAYAEERWKAGIDVIVLGHFHEERFLSAAYNGREHALHVLPAWKDTHEFLAVDTRGNAELRCFT